MHVFLGVLRATGLLQSLYTMRTDQEWRHWSIDSVFKTADAGSAISF